VVVVRSQPSLRQASPSLGHEARTRSAHCARVVRLCVSGRVSLGRVPLSQAPSLHHLRSPRGGLVRRLRRSYGPVRLPRPMYRLTALAFPIPPGQPWAALASVALGVSSTVRLAVCAQLGRYAGFHPRGGFAGATWDACAAVGSGSQGPPDTEEHGVWLSRQCRAARWATDPCVRTRDSSWIAERNRPNARGLSNYDSDDRPDVRR
jgi:hypothetical protein